MDDAPTAQSSALFEDLSGRAAPDLARYREVVAKDIAELNRRMEEVNGPGVVLAGGDIGDGGLDGGRAGR